MVKKRSKVDYALLALFPTGQGQKLGHIINHRHLSSLFIFCEEKESFPHAYLQEKGNTKETQCRSEHLGL